MRGLVVLHGLDCRIIPSAVGLAFVRALRSKC
jgi:hypothetical protein